MGSVKTEVDERTDTLSGKMRVQSCEVTIVWEEAKETKKEVLKTKTQKMGKSLKKSLKLPWKLTPFPWILISKAMMMMKKLPRKYESTEEDRNITDDLVTEMLQENVKILEIIFPCWLSCNS